MSILKLIAAWFSALPTYMEARHNPRLANHLMRDESAKRGYKLMEISVGIIGFLLMAAICTLGNVLGA